ncbi:MAG TPA: type IX secretion system membrane protein PorP/SprF [Flavobacteriales bacterium]|nr:type IX secretion system membrane protein PorP/SprF [Flavobacteriales bacterium]
MRRLRTLPLLLLAILCVRTAHAQQEVMVSQYMFNGLFLNPGYAGSHPYVSASLLHRAQWMNVDGAPRTSMLAIDGPLLGEKMGVGFTLVNDRIGISHETEVAGEYAYRIRTGATGRLAFGLKAGIGVYSANLNELVYWDAQDALYQQNIKNTVLGKFGFGLYWHDDRSFVGLSVPTLYAADGALTSAVASALDHYYVQHYYLYAGHVFELNESFDLKPSVLLKYQQQAPPEVDLNCNVLFRDRFWLGVGYRTGDAVVGMVEYQISPMFRLGYAYDMTTSKLSTYTSGTHEVMLGMSFGRDPIKIKTPRYF